MPEKTEIYARHKELYSSVPKPDHVPQDLVVDFDYLHPAEMDKGKDVYEAWKTLHNGPDIVWTPRNGGHWLVTRLEDAKFIQENFQIFSHEEFTIPRGSSPVKMPPLTVDPPLHARYRAILNPFFTPSAVRTMRETADALTTELIEWLKPRGGCEFVNDFARVMPVTMFLGIVDLPLDRREEFVEWGVTFMTSTDPETKLGAQNKVIAYLTEVLSERYKKPGNDLLSKIAGWKDNPRYEGEHEIIGMALLVFFGGLDTVANLLSFVTRHLATHPELRKRLIVDPAIIPQAAEEFFRRFGLSNTGRLVKGDYEYKGALFKKEEMVMVSNPLASMDDHAFNHPMDVDFDRGEVPNNTFGNGPHKCVGQPLARAELQVFLSQWLKHIPVFRLDEKRPPKTHSGAVIGLDHLHLVWDA